MLYYISIFLLIKVGALFPPKIRSFKQRSWRPLAPWICQDMPRRTIFGRWVRSVLHCVSARFIQIWEMRVLVLYVVCVCVCCYKPWATPFAWKGVGHLSSVKTNPNASPFFGASQPWFDALRLGMIFFHMLFLGGISTGLMTVACSILFDEGLEVCHFRWGKLATVGWEWISSSDLV